MLSHHFFSELLNNKIDLCIDQLFPDTLYHYTNVNSLMSITDNKCFWASQSDYLNDYTEIKHIQKIILKVCTILEENSSICFNQLDYSGRLFNTLVEKIKSICSDYEAFISSQPNKLYILSLSQNKDSFALFSNYTNHFGYNLGFKSSELVNHLEQNIQHVNNDKKIFIARGKVNYDEKSQISIIQNDILDLYNEVFKILEEKYSDIQLEDGKRYIPNKIATDIFYSTLDFLMIKLYIYSMFFKNQLLSQEEEYRFIYVLDKDTADHIVEFRSNNSIIIPFVKTHIFKNDTLSSVTVGPKINIDIALKSIENYLRIKNYKDVRVVKSEVPIRF